MFDPVEILRRLVEHRTDFIVVGGIAASLAGSTVITSDLDLVYRNEEENNLRLAEVLEGLEAIYRDPAGRRIEPTAERLAMYRMNLLRTSLGDLDLLRTIGADLGYEDLLSRSIEYDLDGLKIRAIDLATLIEAKRFANRPKDLYAIPFLEELLRQQRIRGEAKASGRS